jgi:hypothetical protein
MTQTCAFASKGGHNEYTTFRFQPESCSGSGGRLIGQGLPNESQRSSRRTWYAPVRGRIWYASQNVPRYAPDSRQESRSNQRVGVFEISVVVCECSAAAASTAASIARSRAALGSVAANSARCGKSSVGNDMVYWSKTLVSQEGNTENCAGVLRFARSNLGEGRRYFAEIAATYSTPRGIDHEREFQTEQVAYRRNCEARGRSARSTIQLRTPRRCGGRISVSAMMS